MEAILLQQFHIIFFTNVLLIFVIINYYSSEIFVLILHPTLRAQYILFWECLLCFPRALFLQQYAVFCVDDCSIQSVIRVVLRIYSRVAGTDLSTTRSSTGRTGTRASTQGNIMTGQGWKIFCAFQLIKRSAKQVYKCSSSQSS